MSAEPDALRWRSLADDQDLAETAAAIERDMPPFLWELTSRSRAQLEHSAPATTFVLHDDDLPLGVVRAAALRWDGTRGDAPGGGAGEVLARVGEQGADTLAVLDVVLAFGARGRGHGSAALAGLRERASAIGLPRVLVLQRTHAKSRYPLVPFGRYLGFARTDGMPFDPWLRSAWRAGMVPVAAVDRSLVARADVASWRRWFGDEIPGSGPYLVEGAIKPAIVELERDEGRYREPALWVTPREDLAEPPGPDAHWAQALAAAGIVPGDRSHREVRRRR